MDRAGRKRTKRVGRRSSVASHRPRPWPAKPASKSPPRAGGQAPSATSPTGQTSFGREARRICWWRPPSRPARPAAGCGAVHFTNGLDSKFYKLLNLTQTYTLGAGLLRLFEAKHYVLCLLVGTFSVAVPRLLALACDHPSWATAHRLLHGLALCGVANGRCSTSF